MRAYKIAALGLFAILPVAAVACGSSSSKKSTPDASGTTANATTSGSKNSPAAGATSGSSSSDNPIADLQNAGKALKNGTFKVSYDMTQTDSDGTTTNGTLSLSTQDKKSYFKLTGLAGGDSGGAYIIIDDGTNSFICTDQPTKQCLKSSSTGDGSAADAFQPSNILNELSANGGSFKETGDQNIAGRSAKCYEGSDDSGKGTACIDKKTNLLLLVDSTQTDGSKMTLKATSIGTPSDSDFKPPYPVQTIPGQ